MLRSVSSNFPHQSWLATKNKADFWLFVLVYSLAHGWVFLIPNALYWDDWVLHQTSPEALAGLFRQAGSMFNIGAYGHILLQNLGGWWYKTAVFVFFLGSGLLLNKILKRGSFLREDARILIVLLYLVLPLNFARVAQINFFYAFCNFVFFAAWLAMDRYRLLAAILFFVSFNTNSLLVFYALPFIDYCARHKLYIPSEVRKRWHTVVLFAAMPFTYFFIKTIYFKPFGLYANYNSGFALGNIVTSMNAQLRDIRHELILLALPLAGIFILSLVVFFVVRRITGKKNADETREGWISLILLGLSVIALGCFPYWIVGHVPTTQEWTSRHQLLMPLGTAFFLAGIYKIFGSSWSKFLTGFTVVASIAIWFTTYQSFYFDWKKQEKLIALFSKNDELHNARLLVFHDETTDLNAIGRTYRQYEWNGLMALAFGDERRYGLLPQELDTYCQGQLDMYFVDHYKSKEHTRAPACSPLNIRIVYGKKNESSGWRRNFEKINNIDLVVY